MPILNLKFFLDKVEPILQICPNCYGQMNEVPLKVVDLGLLILSKKKIVRRYRCVDCMNETLLKK